MGRLRSCGDHYAAQVLLEVMREEPHFLGSIKSRVHLVLARTMTEDDRTSWRYQVRMTIAEAALFFGPGDKLYEQLLCLLGAVDGWKGL